MDEWFCQIAGREIGPLKSHQLKAMAAQGQIVPADKVRRGATGHWVPASHVRGLFVAAQAPPQTVVEPPSFFGSAPPPAQLFSNAPEPNVAWPTAPPAGPAPPEAPPPLGPPLAPPVCDATADDSAPFDVFDEPADQAAIGHAVKHRAALAHAKRKRQQQMLVAGSVIFVIFGLAMAALLLSFVNLSDLTSIKDDVQQTGGLSGLSQKLKRAASDTADGNGETPPSREGLAPSDSAKAKKPTDENPAEAAGLRMVVGDVPVHLASIARGADRAGTPASQCLLVTIEVKNPSAHDKMEFLGWSSDAALRGATLTDDQGKTYAVKPVNVAAVLGAPLRSSIAPGEWGRDVLCFESPGPKAQSFQLELPGAAFGKDASASFQIPVKMMAAKPVVVRSAPKPGSNAKPRRQPKPGTPEYDFGIREDEDIHH